MANLLAEGLGGIALGTTQIGYRFSATNALTITNTTNPVPPGGQAARGYGSSGGPYDAGRFNIATHTVGFWGQRCLPSDVGASAASYYPLVAFHGTDGTRNFYVAINSTGRIEVRNNSNTVLGTGTNIFPLSDWFYLEVGYTMSATVGAVEVKVTRSGAVTTELALTGINNVAGIANVGAVSPIWIRSDGNANNFSPATYDYYCNDNSGAVDNTYWGDTRYEYIYPSAAGNSTQFTPSAGSNWDAVNESPGHNTDTDYVENNVSGNKDLYTMTDPITTASVIRNVKVIVTARAPAGGASLKIDVRSGSTTSAGASQAASTGAYAELYRDLKGINPVTSAAWTLAEVNALEAGFEVA